MHAMRDPTHPAVSSAGPSAHAAGRRRQGVARPVVGACAPRRGCGVRRARGLLRCCSLQQGAGRRQATVSFHRLRQACQLVYQGPGLVLVQVQQHFAPPGRHIPWDAAPAHCPDCARCGRPRKGRQARASRRCNGPICGHCMPAAAACTAGRHWGSAEPRAGGAGAGCPPSRPSSDPAAPPQASRGVSRPLRHVLGAIETHAPDHQPAHSQQASQVGRRHRLEQRDLRAPSAAAASGLATGAAHPRPGGPCVLV